MEILKNKREIFVKILKEICTEQNYQIDFFSQDWIVKISNKEATNFIIAYNFGINKNAPAKICADKTATTEILTYQNVPNVEHRLFHIHDNYQGNEGNWPRMINFFNENNKKIVMKPNVGSSGIGVVLVDTLYQLEQETYKRLKRKSAICLSAFEDIIDEYRVVMLDNEPQLIFKKKKPSLVGNGVDTILDLLSQSYDLSNIPIQVLESMKKNQLDLKTVVEKDRTIELNWKHNLGSGAIPEIIKIEDYPELVNLAQLTVKALGMSFCSVDIILTAHQEVKVLEVNSGVMMINFALDSEVGYQLAKRIYKKAVMKMMKN